MDIDNEIYSLSQGVLLFSSCSNFACNKQDAAAIGSSNGRGKSTETDLVILYLEPVSVGIQEIGIGRQVRN